MRQSIVVGAAAGLQAHVPLRQSAIILVMAAPHRAEKRVVCTADVMEFFRWSSSGQNMRSSYQSSWQANAKKRQARQAATQAQQGGAQRQQGSQQRTAGQRRQEVTEADRVRDEGTRTTKGMRACHGSLVAAAGAGRECVEGGRSPSRAVGHDLQ